MTTLKADAGSDPNRSKTRKLSVEIFDLGQDKSGAERKIGHRRVGGDGQVTYKKRPTSELMAAIQLGIGQSVGGLAPKPMRDVLYEDFHVVETVFFPKEGSNMTPAHHCSDFRFKTYAPVAFRYFRELFKIRTEDFLLSLCSDPLVELSNPGASGSIFYVTENDEFIIKTVQHKEAEFLQKLLPGYYMNLNQNPCTLLPKFYGLFCYQCGGKNIRFVVMNNILPSCIVLHEKYDLKGSTYKRKASKHEKSKATPTLKDLDFLDLHTEGVLLEPDTYSALIKTINRDCRVLESFKIMDYSLLVGVHNMDKEISSNMRNYGHTAEIMALEASTSNHQQFGDSTANTDNMQKSAYGRSGRPRLAQYSTAMESIQAHNFSVSEDDNINPGGIPGTNGRGERLLLYIGIIDILQSYRLTKKLEHAVKSLIHDGDTVSVHHPEFYAQRFQTFFAQTAFRMTRPSPVKRKSIVGRKSLVPADTEKQSGLLPIGPYPGRPDVLPQPTPLRTIEASVSCDGICLDIDSASISQKVSKGRPSLYKRRSEEFLSTSSHLSATSMCSIATSTPTHTQQTDATMSYTESSPSASSENILDSCMANIPSVPSLPRDADSVRLSTNNIALHHTLTPSDDVDDGTAAAEDEITYL